MSQMLMNLESVEVYNNENIVNIKVVFQNINLKAKLDKNDFALDNLIDTTKNEEETPPF